MPGFVSIGECMIELSARKGSCCRLGFAGDTFNTAWYVRGSLPLNYPVRYFTSFGDDPLSKEQKEFIEDKSIDTSLCTSIEGSHPGLYVVSLDESGERTFTYWREASAARKLATSPMNLRECIEGADFAYFSGITMAILDTAGREVLLNALEDARMSGVRVAFDSNYRRHLWARDQQARYWHDRAAAVSDLFLATENDIEALYGGVDSSHVINTLTNLDVSELVIKNGPAFATLWHEGKIEKVPAHRVQVCDTTGAGDSFNGGYIAARIAGKNVVDAALLGHRIAAQTVSTYGALFDLKKVFELTQGWTHD